MDTAGTHDQRGPQHEPPHAPPHTLLQQALLDACLDLLEQTGWRGFFLHAVPLPPGVCQEFFQTYIPSPERVVELWFEATDHAMVQRMAQESLGIGDGENTPPIPVEEMLLEGLMGRFEVLLPRRTLASGLLRDSILCPKLGGILFRGVHQMMERLLGTQNLPLTWDVFVPLFGIYGVGFRAWERDKTPDLSETLVALHQAFHHAAPFFASLSKQRCV